MYVPNDMLSRHPNSAYLFFNTVLICTLLYHCWDMKQLLQWLPIQTSHQWIPVPRFQVQKACIVQAKLTNAKLWRKLMVLYQNSVIICIPPSGWASSETHSLTLSVDGTPARSRPSTLHHPKHEISEITLKNSVKYEKHRQTSWPRQYY